MAYAAPHHGFRTFVIVWLAQSLSVIGSGMTGFALNVYLAQVLYPAPEQKPELALAFTVLNLGFTIPFVFGGPIAGAWADRHDRKQIMIMTNTANGLISLLTVFLMLSGSLQLWMLVSIGVLAAAASPGSSAWLRGRAASRASRIHYMALGRLASTTVGQARAGTGASLESAVYRDLRRQSDHRPSSVRPLIWAAVL